jgi:predicted HicB family RNase H-like nuclease
MTNKRGDKTAKIEIRVSPSFKARVQKAAGREGLTMSAWVEAALQKALRSANHTAGADN